METFSEARKRHESVGRHASINIDKAAALWGAVSGSEEPDPKQAFAYAVRDTVPAEHAPLLRENSVAAAYAFGIMARRGAHATVVMMTSSLARRDAAREAWKEFDVRAKQTEELANAFDWDLSDAWEHASKVAIAGGSMEMVSRIGNLAGRMHAALRGARAANVAGVPTSVHSTEVGNNISRLLPSEKALLMDPVLETVVLARIAGRKASQYAMRGDDKRSRGPFVIAVDESGSMQGKRNEWAKAAIVALARIAKAEKRPVSVVHYSTSCVVNKMAFDPAGLGKILCHFLNGGTAIGRALNVSADEIQAMAAKGHRGADVVLITDGIDYDVAAQADAVRRLGGMDARLWTVAIECDIPVGNILRDKSSQYIKLGGEQLVDGKSVVSLAGAL